MEARPGHRVGCVEGDGKEQRMLTGWTGRWAAVSGGLDWMGWEVLLGVRWY